MDTHKVLMKESGVNLTLTVVDTPGFGDAVDNSGCWDPVTHYVEAQYEAFLDAETRVNRVSLPDGRVSTWGPRLKLSDNNFKSFRGVFG